MNLGQLRFGDPRYGRANAPVRGGPPGQGSAPSRRHFLRSAAGASGLLLAANGSSARAGEDCPPPVPIPGGLDFLGTGTVYHVYAHGYPGFGGDPGEEDPSSIYHFNGDVGVAYVRGMGTHTDKATGVQTHLPWEVDLRFMKGDYVGADGKRHYGAFAFV
jgi:hypothetical protein